MKIIIDDNAKVIIENDNQHKGQNSNDYINLEFEFSEYWNEFNKYIEFEGKNLAKVAYLIEDDTFNIPCNISEHQEVTCDLFMKKTENGVTEQTPTNQWKMYFDPSVNANPDMIEEKPDVIDKLVGDVLRIEEDIEDLEGSKHSHSNKSILDNTTASYTTEEKNKLAELENYDDTEVKNDISNIKQEQTTQNTNIETNRTNIETETTNRQNADLNLQQQIDAIVSASDVVDVVSSYSDLQNYDTSKITADDVVKVMQDSTHNNAISYFRWVITNNVGAWNYVGSEGPFYTRGETEEKLADYVKNTDYATDSKAGIVRLGYGFALNNDHKLYVNTYSYNNYSTQSNATAISKGTLENVLTEKIGDIETALTNLNTEAEAI